MNLAIEYFLRSGTANDALEIPCSLHLNHMKNKDYGLVVTIHKNPDSGQYLVRHWHLHQANDSSTLPPFDEFYVESRDQLLTSPLTVVPMHALLEFQERPYKAGTKQRSRGRKALTQQLEYKETMESFFNTSINIQLRKCWLWMHFLRSQGMSLSLSDICRNIDEQMSMVNSHYMQSWAKWELWNKQMSFDTGVAIELIFHQAYGIQLSKKMSSPPSTRPSSSVWPPNLYWEASRRNDSCGIWHGTGI